jgi:hypothetical protein
MKRIAIIESGHFEVTHTLLRLFDNGHHHLTVFIDASSLRQLQFLAGEKTNQLTWVVRPETESNRAFISRIFTHLQSQPFDLVCFSTINDNFILYANGIKKLNTKTTMIVHDINSYFTWKPAPSLRRMVRYLGKHSLIRQADSFIVLGERLAENLRSKLSGSKEVYHVPGGFFEKENYQPLPLPANESIRIVVPGSVDERRRDYRQVFELLRLADEQKVDIAVMLLGRFHPEHGRQAKAWCEAYPDNGRLRYFDESLIDQPLFDKYLQQSHLLWLPLQHDTIIHDGVQETYGETICSGNIGDVIRHAKPFLLPANIHVDQALEQAAIRYRSPQDLLEKLSTADLAQHNAAALAGAQYYMIENIRARVPSLFQ